MITSAGCNALDYLLDEPRQVHAVDVNPKQNALLELKLSAIRNLDMKLFLICLAEGTRKTGGNCTHRICVQIYL